VENHLAATTSVKLTQNRGMQMPQVTRAGVAYSPWIGTPERPQFLKSIFRVEYATPTRIQNVVEVPADNVWEAAKAASKVVGFELTLP
jgi:hypothetical protein